MRTELYVTACILPVSSHSARWGRRTAYDAPHFALTQDEPATVYITGFGPTDTHYIDAAADPDIANP